jgi:hypothetical protein
MSMHQQDKRAHCGICKVLYPTSQVALACFDSHSRSLSSHQHEQAAREQGYYFMADRKMSRWPSLGHKKWISKEHACIEGTRAVLEDRCEGFDVYKVLLVEPFTSERVTI